MKPRPGGLTTTAWVRDGLLTERIPSAIVFSALPRTVISSRLADRIVRDVSDSWRCTSSPSVGKACGPLAKIDVTVDGCRAASVRAVVAPLPRGLDLAIGRDVTEKSVRAIDFATRPATFRCRVTGRR
jgi:hypothetical protein